MSSFTTPLIVKHIDGLQWEVIRPFSYHLGSKYGKEIINVPKGFITDFASIPKFAWSIIGAPTGKYGKAAVIHDYLYHTLQYSRKKSDDIFYEAMGISGVPDAKRRIMYLAVRMFAWIIWNKRSSVVKRK